MLLEFSVENYRSIAEEQKLSMNAGRFHSERIGAVMNTGSKTSPHLLRAMAIMGSNGSGKSTLVEGLDFLQSFVRNSAQKMQLGDEIDVIPHKLESKWHDKPSRFGISFHYIGVDYSYHISVNKYYVEEECLISRPKGKSPREIFSRVRESRETGYRWNVSGLPSEKVQIWQESTRENGLFLSTAVQLNSEDLSAPFEWLTKKLRVQTKDDEFSAALTSHLIKDHVDDGCREEIMNLLREADVGIRSVEIRESVFDESQVPDFLSKEVRELILSQSKGQKVLLAEFLHRGRDGGAVSFALEEESSGTQKLYEMAGPIISTIRHGWTLVVDELDSSLHSLLLRMIVSLFQSPKCDDCNAQLIFTTHDDGLLDSKILERDQFIFVEKFRGATSLIPLNDYRPRRGEAMRLNYLRGRYGGVPAISRVKVM